MDELVVEVEVVLDEDEVLEGRSRVCCEDLEQTPPDREKCERKTRLGSAEFAGFTGPRGHHALNPK